MLASKALSVFFAGSLFAAGLVLLPSLASAERPRVQRVAKHRFKCSWSNGATTYTTAANRKEARSNCEGMASQVPGATLTDVTDASRMESIKEKAAPAS